ncbi:hypothetical protein GSI_00036 [Ganoderma sinense ZZ0214-1]|uniref:Uncharacterized protein n=1 Tax=Ganoderma sinense ZZ0214-1 TaxID=1077348 RepID=A0A2G8SRZ5_9APHY|nr:hypothetical protein GSI_00036 [Ganoderma sinense ZZ0214-1]
MAPFFWTENKTRSLEPSSAAADSMATQAVALFCASVLIFLVFLGSSIVLIRRRRLRHRTQDTTAEVEAQIVQLPAREPAASQPDSKEKGESVSPSRSSSSKSSAAVPLLPLATAPCSGLTATAEKPVEKLMARTSAALSKADKYTTLPLRRARQARQSKLAQKNPVLDFSTPLATLDAEIVNSEANSAAGRRSSESHQPSMRSTSLTVGTETPSRSELLLHSTAIAPSTCGQPEPALRPSPTVASMEVRPLEADAAALPDAKGMGMLVSGSLPSFSSAFSASSICQLADDGHAPPEADSLKEKEANKHSFASLDCETPRGRNPVLVLDAEKGTPSCSESTPSLSTVTTLTRRDSSFSSDADTVCELGPGKMSLITVTGKASKLCDPLSFPVAVSDLSLDISSDKGDDIVSSRPNSGTDDLGGLTKYSGDLTTLV